jgi:AcrR family transcriptional regulator
MARPKPRNRRDDIVEAARRLFAAKGIRATTVRDIAQASGLTEGALYRHFSSKEELARWLFGESVRSLYDHLQHAAAAAESLPARLCALAQGLFDFARLQPDTYEYVMTRHQGGLGSLPPEQKPPLALFAETLQEGMKEGVFYPMDPTVGAAIAIGLCQRVIFVTTRGLTVSSRDEVAAEVCRALQQIFYLPLRPESGATTDGLGAVDSIKQSAKDA